MYDQHFIAVYCTVRLPLHIVCIALCVWILSTWVQNLDSVYTFVFCFNLYNLCSCSKLHEKINFSVSHHTVLRFFSLCENKIWFLCWRSPYRGVALVSWQVFLGKSLFLCKIISYQIKWCDLYKILSMYCIYQLYTFLEDRIWE